jgi:hypothetical protein
LRKATFSSYAVVEQLLHPTAMGYRKICEISKHSMKGKINLFIIRQKTKPNKKNKAPAPNKLLI